MDIIQLFAEPIIKILPKLPTAFLNLLIGYVFIKFIIWFLGHVLKFTKLPRLRGILLSLINLGLWVLLMIFVANGLGFDKLAVAISGSVLVLAFILNTGIAPLIADIVSGIFLCTDPDFKVGSKVKIGNGDSAVEGIIKEVDMRKVRILDSDDNIVVIPNSVTDKDKWIVIEKPIGIMKSKTVAARDKAKKAIKNKLNK